MNCDYLLFQIGPVFSNRLASGTFSFLSVLALFH